MYLYHYFERQRGPLLNLSDLPVSEAQHILNGLKEDNQTFAAHRYEGYLQRRHELEQMIRKLFILKGGEPLRPVPHYFVLEPCPWLETWYLEPDFIKIPIHALETNTISFTYGDMFPTFSPRVTDGREYRNTLYTYEEILDLITRYGLPQQWNADGRYGPERYIEAHVWCDLPKNIYLSSEVILC